MKNLVLLFLIATLSNNLYGMAINAPTTEQTSTLSLLQPDGKKLIFRQGDEPHTWELLRFNSDDSPDSSFGLSGKMAHMGDEFESVLTPIAMEIENDGNILLIYSEKDKNGAQKFFQSRINPDGRYVFFKRGITALPIYPQKLR